jgi:acyl-coenzyme A synthetase/AMP-(fatty) acid ligase
MRHMRFTEQSRLATMFDHAAEHLPQGTVAVGSGSPVLGPPRTWSYAELAAVVRELSGWFPAATPIGRGDHVVIAKRNHPDIVLLAAAASRAGAVPALISATVPAPQARVLLERLRPVAVVADTTVAEAWGLAGGGDPWKLVVVDGPVPGGIPIDDLRGAPEALVPWRHPSEPMVVTHTSGTTGVPKLVLHSGETLGARAKVVTSPIPVLSVRRRDRYAAYLPWSHARAIEYVTSSLHIGGRSLALSDPDPAGTAPVLEAFRPTVLESVPNVYLLWEGVAAQARELFARVRLYLNAFDAMHPRTVRAFLAAAPRRALWLQGYGQSEVGCVTVAAYGRRTVRPRPDRPPTLRDQGWASWPMSRIRVTDPETGEPVGKRRTGQFEVQTRGRVLTYVGQEGLHARRVRGRWWTTGDIGYLTRSGRTMLSDRHIDRIPGVDSCLEVEDRLLDALPELTEVALLNIGGEPVPVVCTAGDAPLDRARWSDAARSFGGTALAAPVHLPWDAVPRTGTYKVRRQALVETLLDERSDAAGTGRPTPTPVTAGGTP